MHKTVIDCQWSVQVVCVLSWYRKGVCVYGGASKITTMTQTVSTSMQYGFELVRWHGEIILINGNPCSCGARVRTDWSVTVARFAGLCDGSWSTLQQSDSLPGSPAVPIRNPSGYLFSRRLQHDRATDRVCVHVCTCENWLKTLYSIWCSVFKLCVCV